MLLPLSQRINRIRLEKKFTDDEFKPLCFNEWRQIKEKLSSQLCNPSTGDVRFRQVCNELSGQTDLHSACMYTSPYRQLNRLVSQSEKVWLVLEDSIPGENSYLLYEGYIKPIVKVIQESGLASDLYILSKQYDWLIHINQHNVIIAAGHEMPGKLRKLQRNLFTRANEYYHAVSGQAGISLYPFLSPCF